MPEKKKDTKKYRGSIKFQLILLLIFASFLAFLLYQTTKVISINDQFPPIIALNTKEIVRLGGDPTVVTVGIYIRDFPTFDIFHNKLSADLTVWFKFDPNKISLDKIGKFFISNARFLYKDKPYTKIVNGQLFAKYNIAIEFTTNLNYENFPLDDHTINIIITNQFFSPNEVIFKIARNNLIIDPDIDPIGWDLVDKKVESGYVETNLDPLDKKIKAYYPRVISSLYFKKSGTRKLITIFIPLFLIFYIALMTFTLNPFTEFGRIIGISISSISAVLAYRFIIGNLSPETGYLMISDRIFMVILVICCVIFFINLFSKKITGWYKNILALLFHVYAILALLYIIYPTIVFLYEVY